MRQVIITFGLLIVCSLVLFQAGRFAYFKYSLPVELLIGIFAFVFLRIRGKIKGNTAAKSHDEQSLFRFLMMTATVLVIGVAVAALSALILQKKAER
jgi:hypothetical protein